MYIYVLLSALVGIIAGIMIAVCVKRADGVVYGKLEKTGIITNIVMAFLYGITSPAYLFLGMLSEPAGEGAAIIPGVIVGVIIGSASMICSLGLGFSVAFRKRGKSILSFAIQFVGIIAITISLVLYIIFAQSLFLPIN